MCVPGRFQPEVRNSIKHVVWLASRFANRKTSGPTLCHTPTVSPSVRNPTATATKGSPFDDPDSNIVFPEVARRLDRRAWQLKLASCEGEWRAVLGNLTRFDIEHQRPMRQNSLTMPCATR
jgi:hypothetical protein